MPTTNFLMYSDKTYSSHHKSKIRKKIFDDLKIEIPLSDEGYEYRAPTMILLQKGQNKVRIKIPIKELKGKDWQNPAKYMFTFVPVE